MSFGNNIRGDVFVENNYRPRFKDIDQIMALDKKKLEAYRSLILKLSKQVRETIIIRPHPEENHAYYLNAVKNIENVRVLYQGSVIPWLLSTSCMIHPDCTTAIEYLFSNKIPLSYLPIGYPKDFVTELPLAASKCFTHEDELISFIIEKGDSDKFHPDNYPFAEDYFSISKSTMKLIIDGFCSIRDNTPNIRSEEFSLTSLLFLKYSGVLRKLIGKNESHRLSNNKLKGFNKKNVQQIHNKIVSHNDPMTVVNCKPINGQLYVFSR